jgi:hypothetical protein
LDPSMSQRNEARHTNDNQAKTQYQNHQYPLQTHQSELAQAHPASNQSIHRTAPRLNNQPQRQHSIQGNNGGFRQVNQVNSPSMPNSSNVNARDPLNQAHHQQYQNINSSVSRVSTGASPYNPPGVPPPQQRQYGTPHHYQHPQNQNQQGGNQGQASMHVPQHARTIPTQPQQAQQAGQGYKFGDLSRSVIAKGKKGDGRDEKSGYKFGESFVLLVGFISMRCAYNQGPVHFICGAYINISSFSCLIVSGDFTRGLFK